MLLLKVQDLKRLFSLRTTPAPTTEILTTNTPHPPTVPPTVTTQAPTTTTQAPTTTTQAPTTTTQAPTTTTQAPSTTTQPPPTTTQASTTTQPPADICRGNHFRFVADPFSCYRFYFCMFVPLPGECAEDRIFEERLSGCVLGDRETCTRNDDNITIIVTRLP